MLKMNGTTTTSKRLPTNTITSNLARNEREWVRLPMWMTAAGNTEDDDDKPDSQPLPCSKCEAEGLASITCHQHPTTTTTSVANPSTVTPFPRSKCEMEGLHVTNTQQLPPPQQPTPLPRLKHETEGLASIACHQHSTTTTTSMTNTPPSLKMRDGGVGFH